MKGPVAQHRIGMNTPLPHADTRIGSLVSGLAWPTIKASILTESGGHEVLRKQPGLPIHPPATRKPTARDIIYSRMRVYEAPVFLSRCHTSRNPKI